MRTPTDKLLMRQLFFACFIATGIVEQQFSVLSKVRCFLLKLGSVTYMRVSVL